MEKMFKKMKQKKMQCNCISKLFPKLLFFINLQKREKMKEQGNDIRCFQTVNLNLTLVLKTTSIFFPSNS